MCPAARALVDRLEQAGYVRRRRDPADRRRVVLEVTDTTVTRSLAAVRPLVEAVTAIGHEFDEPTRQVVTTYLTRVAEVMADFTNVDTTLAEHP